MTHDKLLNQYLFSSLLVDQFLNQNRISKNKEIWSVKTLMRIIRNRVFVSFNYKTVNSSMWEWNGEWAREERVVGAHVYRIVWLVVWYVRTLKCVVIKWNVQRAKALARIKKLFSFRCVFVYFIMLELSLVFAQYSYWV